MLYGIIQIQHLCNNRTLLLEPTFHTDVDAFRYIQRTYTADYDRVGCKLSPPCSKSEPWPEAANEKVALQTRGHLHSVEIIVENEHCVFIVDRQVELPSEDETQNNDPTISTWLWSFLYTANTKTQVSNEESLMQQKRDTLMYTLHIVALPKTVESSSYAAMLQTPSFVPPSHPHHPIERSNLCTHCNAMVMFSPHHTGMTVPPPPPLLQPIGTPIRPKTIEQKKTDVSLEPKIESFFDEKFQEELRNRLKSRRTQIEPYDIS